MKHFTPPTFKGVAAVPILAAALVALAVLAPPALALGPNYCYDDRGRALEVPTHFQSRFPGGTHRADGLNCKRLPVGDNPRSAIGMAS